MLATHPVPPVPKLHRVYDNPVRLLELRAKAA
jgi:hypothetical protein